MQVRAALFIGPDAPIEVHEIELDPPGPGDVRVRMSAVGVCGSDLHVVRGEWKRPTPMVLGHEGSGIIEEVGAEVTNVAPGDRVIVHWAPSCGECAACRRGRPATCAALRAAIAAGTLVDGSTYMRWRGAPVYRMTAVGAFAEQVVISANSAIALPDGIPLREAALIGCAALTGVGAVANVARVEPNTHALVIGAGGVGQFVIQALGSAGASEIVAVDPGAERRDAAVAFGATRAIAPDELGALLAERREGFDVAFEAVGSPVAIRTAVDATRIGGLTTLVGMTPTGSEVAFDAFAFTAQEKQLVGSLYGSADPAVTAAGVFDDVQDGRLNLSPMLGPEFSLDDIDQAVATALGGRHGRVLVLPNGPTDG